MKEKTLILFVTAIMTLNAADVSLTELEQMSARFAPVDLRVDTSRLSAGDRAALVKLIEAARVVNHIFLQQLWSGNLALYDKLKLDTTPLGKARLEYFWLNKGPWSDLDDHQAFLPGVPERKPLGAAFLSRRHDARGVRELGEDFEAGEPRAGGRILYGDPARQANGRWRRSLFGGLHGGSAGCAQLLRDAAKMTDNATLKHSSKRGRRRFFRTITTRATWRGWIWTRRSTSRSALTKPTTTNCSV